MGTTKPKQRKRRADPKEIPGLTELALYHLERLGKLARDPDALKGFKPADVKLEIRVLLIQLERFRKAVQPFLRTGNFNKLCPPEPTSAPEPDPESDQEFRKTIMALSRKYRKMLELPVVSREHILARA